MTITFIPTLIAVGRISAGSTSWSTPLGSRQVGAPVPSLVELSDDALRAEVEVKVLG